MRCWNVFLACSLAALPVVAQPAGAGGAVSAVASVGAMEPAVAGTDTGVPQEAVAAPGSDTVSQDAAAAAAAEPQDAGAAPVTSGAAGDTPAADDGADVLPPAERPRPADARALFAGFARIRGLQARFVEQKTLPLLVLPLTNTGRLHYLAPGHLLQVVEAPEPASFLITPESLRIEGRDGSRTIDLRSSAALDQLVTSLVRVLAGDEQALAASYSMTYATPDDSRDWTLTLTPRSEPLTGMLRSLTLTGTGAAVSTITRVEPDGMRVVLSLEAVDAARAYSADERQRLFGIEPG